MQTRLPLQLLETPIGQDADRILRSCVHCGFCTATCPTYQLTGNELDSPRGRIYLIKEVLETGNASGITRTHLDRCLACQACETTCPSDVDYHSLLNIGREALQQISPEKWGMKFKHRLFLQVLGSATLFKGLLKLGQIFKFVLPESLARQLPGKSAFSARKDIEAKYNRKVVLLNGCVQSSLSPDTNQAASLILNSIGIDALTLTNESCCGAMAFHSNQQEKGLFRAKALIDQLIGELDTGAEALISTASGCGNFIKDYLSAFKHDDQYLVKARRVSEFTKDIGEFLRDEDLSRFKSAGGYQLAFHSPCSLQHGQQLGGVVEELLEQLGYILPRIENSHLCCGSAGTYSLFQPQMAKALRQQKILTLEESGSENIATANIGCQCHLAGGSDKPVKHWLEYVATMNVPG